MISYRELSDALFWSWFYDGMDEFVEELACHLYEFDQVNDDLNWKFSRWEDLPSEWTDMVPQEFWDKVWMVLVLLFGEYGTSPRSGWILNAHEASSFLIDGMRSAWLSDSEFLRSDDGKLLCLLGNGRCISDRLLKTMENYETAEKED